MNLALTSDKEFIQRLTEIVEANLGDENFGVDELVRKTGMARTKLNRKLHLICRKSISQFIREVRLQKAMEMLRQENLTASEVAFQVGFSSAAYFNTAFHEYYGCPPGEVKKRGITGVEVNNSKLVPGKEANVAEETSHVRKNLFPRRILYAIAGILVMIVLSYLVYTSFFLTREKSIAVLPFYNLSDDKGNMYFADGMMEDILTSLSHIEEFKVISRTSVEQFRGSTLSISEISKKLKVNYVLEGSVQLDSDKVRVRIQLIDAKSDHHLLSETYDRGLTDIFNIQSEIAVHIANKLNTELSETEVTQIRKSSTRNPEAYDYYLRGRFLRNKSGDEQRINIDREGLLGSIKYFEKAVAADTNFAQAYAEMAGAWLSLSGWGWLTGKEGFLKARDLSMKALVIDPDCSEAHKVKGAFHLWGEGRFEEARKELLLSLQLNPDYPPTYQTYTQLLMITGPIDEARIYMNHALMKEPFYWVLHNLNAWIYYFEGKHKEAIKACMTALDLKSDYIFTNWLLFLNYAKLGEGMKAVEELQKIVGIVTHGDRYDNEIMNAFEKSGIKGLFIWLTDININKSIPAAGLGGQPFFIAWWYAIAGDSENSIFWLEKNMNAKQKMNSFFILIATNPDFDILRNDPRFKAIIEKLGLSPYNTRKAR